MSRSARKKPITGVTTCRSEKREKQAWHKRWRRRERIALACKSIEILENHIPSTEKEIIDVWDMSKDGRARWLLDSELTSSVKESAAHHGRRPRERSALLRRSLHRWMSK